MARPEKIAQVESLTEKMKSSEGMVLADFSGLSVAEASDLRRKCREAGVEFKVVKNRLAKRAAAAAELESLDQLLTGPTAIAFGFEGPVEPAKVLVDYAGDNEKVTIKGGFLDGSLLNVAEVQQLSRIPGRQELLAMIARSVQAPAQNIVGVLHGSMAQLVRVLNAVAEKKAEDGDPSVEAVEA